LERAQRHQVIRGKHGGDLRMLGENALHAAASAADGVSADEHNRLDTGFGQRLPAAVFAIAVHELAHAAAEVRYLSMTELEKMARHVCSALEVVRHDEVLCLLIRKR